MANVSKREEIARHRCQEDVFRLGKLMKWMLARGRSGMVSRLRDTCYVTAIHSCNAMLSSSLRPSFFLHDVI